MPGILGRPVEMLAGDPAAAERELRANVEALQQMGETGYLSTLAGDLAEALYVLGRFDEAEHYAQIAEQTAAADDLVSQAQWRSVSAEILARRGHFPEAEALARDAVTLLEPTDFLDNRAETLMALAEVLRLAGRTGEAADRIRDAIELWKSRGNLVRQRQAGELLAKLAPEELAQRD